MSKKELLKPHRYENKRILYYWADTYRRQSKRGVGYETLNKTISVVILEHEIEELTGISKENIEHIKNIK